MGKFMQVRGQEKTKKVMSNKPAEAGSFKDKKKRFLKKRGDAY